MITLEKINIVREQLKLKFIGIDEIIDRFIDSVQIIFLEPDLVTKPIIINFFGLPAVGKSTLVKEFRDLMEIGHSFVEVDVRHLANYTLVDSIEDALGEERSVDSQGKPLFILLEEFHHITNEDASYKDCYDLWSFMSDGKVANNQGDKIK
ncbi:MAG: hypothetical protein ACRCXZ_08770, partial [Patescibacteria group bacterium]